MNVDHGDETSTRWRIAATVGPEMVALALVIVLAISILVFTRLGSSPARTNVDGASPAPSAVSTGSGVRSS
jgi:hypothetical protein